MKKSSKIMLLAVVCCSLFAGQTFGQEASSSDSPKNQTVVLKSAKYDEVQWELDNYIKKHYDDYRMESITYGVPIGEDNRYFETYDLVNDEGDRIEVAFDLTNAYKARNRKGNEALKKRVEGLESAKKDRKKRGLTKEEDKEIGKAISKIMKEDLDRLKAGTLTQEEQEKIMEKLEILVNKLKEEKIEAKKKSSK